MLTQPWLRYELLATLGRLSDWSLRDHSLRCTYAAGDLRAHGQLILDLPEDRADVICVYLYNDGEANAVAAVRAAVGDFFEGGHWASSLLPTKDDNRWTQLMDAAEEARRALILNGLPAWNEDGVRSQ